MLRIFLVFLAMALVGASDVLPAPNQEPNPAPAGPSVSPSPHRAVVNRYCVGCHNERTKSAGLMLDKVDVDKAGEAAPVWEKVIRKLRTDAMPPAGAARPDKATLDSLATYLETEIDDWAASHPNPGNPAVHRLNRTEYTNVIRDLLAIDTAAIDIPALLPADDSSYGFDNIGDVLTVSPTLMEAYMMAARKISRLAIGEPAARPVFETHEVPRYVMQEDRMSEDLPFRSRGGAAIRHHFPVDAEYTIKIRLQRSPGNFFGYIVTGFTEPHEIDLRLDGKRVRLFTIGGDRREKTQAEWDAVDDGLEVRIPVPAGTHVIGVSFIDQPMEPEGVLRPPVTDYNAAPADTKPGIGTVTVGGPYDVKAVGETASRHKIFVCRPQGVNDEDACAKQILSTLARRAYRSPVKERDLAGLLDIYRQGRGLGQEGESFEKGIETALRRILVDPEFLFRIESRPANTQTGAPYHLSDLALASRLSFFLWSSIPDDELLELAERGRLQDPVVLEQQARRMLADPRSRALVENFAGQWLYLRNLEAAWPNPDFYPEFIANLRTDFEKETKLFFESMLRDDRSITELLSADYTFLNERLARHYGVPNVYGGHFRRVTMSDENRKGLLGQGSILMVTSYATRTAPTIRGKWLLENVLGAPPPPPPPDVPSLDETRTADGKALSVRQQMEQHRVNPACASCHRVMDPLGFALENFDATGKWRTRDATGPIDASGTLPDGTKFDGPSDLRKILLSRPEQLVHTVTEKLMTYALGRGVEYYDAPAMRKIVRESAQANYQWSSLIIGIVKSMPFQMRSSS